LGNGSAQVYDHASTAQTSPILGRKNCASARGQYHIVPGAQALNHANFAQTEATLALNIEDPGNICAGGNFDLSIGIGKLETE
jgi:hypothetical protein